MSFLPYWAGAALAAWATMAGAVEAPAPVTMSWLVEQARARDPHLTALAADVDRLRATAAQRRRWDDPALEIEAGRLDQDGDEDDHLKLTVIQRLPLGGSQRAESAGLLADADAARAEGRRAAAERLAELRLAVVDWYLAERRTDAARTAFALTETLMQETDHHLARGQASESDRLRAQVERMEAQQALAAALRRESATRAIVASWVGGSLPTSAAPSVELPPPPAREAVDGLTASHPAVLAAAARTAAAQRQVQASRAEGRPDLDVGVFGERTSDTTDLGIVLGLTVPVWNGNRAGAEAARHGLVRAAATEQAIHRETRRSIAGAYDAWESATASWQSRVELIVVARRASDAALAAYGRGEGDLADVIDARRTLSRITLAATEAEGESHRARIELDRALGSADGFIPETSP